MKMTRFNFSSDDDDDADVEEQEEEIARRGEITSRTRAPIDASAAPVALAEDAAVAANVANGGSYLSPSKPTYSLLGTRLRWVNIGQLFGLPLSPNRLAEPLLSVESPLSHAPVSRRAESEARSERHCQCTHRYADQRTTRHVRFISAVVNFTLKANARSPNSPLHNRKLSAADDIILAPAVLALEEAQGSFASNQTHIDGRFVNAVDLDIIIMPVPESFSSTWSIKHEPSLHMSSDRVKKLRQKKELIRDDNYNIEEITESEVPASRLYSGLKNGNGVHHLEEEDEELPQRQEQHNMEYSESVTIARVPARQEYREGVHYDIDDSRRYRDEVRLVPGEPTPGRYYSTMTECFISSPYRRHRETVFINLHAPSPKQYTTSVFIFPKTCRETFVTEVEHHPEETIKWYRVGVNMEARDYVSVKFMQVDND